MNGTLQRHKNNFKLQFINIITMSSQPSNAAQPSYAARYTPVVPPPSVGANIGGGGGSVSSTAIWHQQSSSSSGHQDAMFEDYEAELRKSFEAIDGVLRDEYSLMTDREIEKHFKHMRQNLQALRLRLGADPLRKEMFESKLSYFTQYSRDLQGKVKDWQRERERKKLLLRNHGRNSAGGGSSTSDYDPVNNHDRQRSITRANNRVEQQLMQGHETLVQANREMHENEDIAHNVIQNLADQRDVITRVRENMGRVGEELDQARGVIGTMLRIRKSQQKRLVSLFLLTLIICACAALAFTSNSASGTVCFGLTAFLLILMARFCGVCNLRQQASDAREMMTTGLLIRTGPRAV
ncbi:unnamed protein product [Amoebophrya sp. A25]|nr:unnamed protein product [Amoebophrya sp. A25]|eukprot:GSA25T00024496001.1